MKLPSPFDATRLASLNGKMFDVVVVGAGINGSAAAQALSSAGYNVLLIDRNDFGSGSSARSSRMMHCGLNYLALAKDACTLKQKARHFLMARRMMRERDRLARAHPDRLSFNTLHIPLTKGDPVRWWQVDVAFLLLRLLGGYATPLNYRRTRTRDLQRHPLARYLGNNLVGIASFSEAIFEWPERLCVDYALSAAKSGATVLNYTALMGASAKGTQWELSVSDCLHSHRATVRARAVVNMTGVWSDQVNRLRSDNAPPTVKPNRGCHLAVRLPAELRGVGLVRRNALGHMFMCMPWRDFHIIGPSETPLEHVDAPLRATDADVDMLLGQADDAMPGAHLVGTDVMFRWAGMRPATYEADNPLGSWDRKVYTSQYSGGPAWMSISWGRIADHAFSARDALAFVTKALGPPLATATAAASPMSSPANPQAPAVDFDHIVANEAPASVADIMFGRTGLGWNADRGLPQAAEAARALARLPAAKSAEQYLADYQAYLAATFG